MLWRPHLSLRMACKGTLHYILSVLCWEIEIRDGSRVSEVHTSGINWVCECSGPSSRVGLSRTLIKMARFIAYTYRVQCQDTMTGQVLIKGLVLIKPPREDIISSGWSREYFLRIIPYRGMGGRREERFTWKPSEISTRLAEISVNLEENMGYIISDWDQILSVPSYR